MAEIDDAGNRKGTTTNELPTATTPLRPPTPGQGKPSGPFFTPDNNFRVNYENAPYYDVRIWRASDGQEWQVMDANQVWHFGINDFVTSVSTSHSIGQQAGQFSIGLLPIRIKTSTDSVTHTWGELLKPMDYVEITMARRRTWVGADDKKIKDEMMQEEDPATKGLLKQSNPNVPYVVLRGFITNVRVVDSVDPQNGIPRRRVMVNGQNFGKLWLLYQIFLLQENNEQIIPKYGNLFTRANNGGFLTPAQFLGVTYGAIFRPQLELYAGTAPTALRERVRKHKVYCDVPSDGRYVISSQNLPLNPSGGPLESFVRTFVTQPYMEFYTYDEPWPGGTPVTIWRWAPLVNRANRFPLPDHIYGSPAVRQLHAYEIQEHDIGNSDNDAYTYYWGGMTQSTGMLATGARQQSPGYLDTGKFRIYGYRPLIPDMKLTNLWSIQDPAIATDPNAYKRTLDNLTNWLAQCFEHNVDNMEGQIICNGRPDIHVGEYLDVPEAGYRYYVENVSHELVVGQGFTTNLTVTRGLPMRDLPRWALPPGYTFNPNAPGSATGTASPGGGPDPNGGYIAPSSDGKTSPPLPSGKTTNPTSPATSGGGGGDAGNNR